MSAEGQTERPPSKGRLAAITVGALAAASVILVGFVLPAEFHTDPTGFGQATGLLKLGTPQPKAETVAAPTSGAATHEYPVPFRTDEVDIPLAAAGDGQRREELEYKVRMKAGDSLIYSWTTVAPPEEFYYDFHGETPAAGAAPAKVVEYKQSTGIASNGALTAPIAGVHGWYLQNQSLKPVVVKLKLAGFYELVPPGAYGNESGIKPKP